MRAVFFDIEPWNMRSLGSCRDGHMLYEAQLWLEYEELWLEYEELWLEYKGALVRAVTLTCFM